LPFWQAIVEVVPVQALVYGENLVARDAILVGILCQITTSINTLAGILGIRNVKGELGPFEGKWHIMS
jgi:hypothetical protein